MKKEESKETELLLEVGTEIIEATPPTVGRLLETKKRHSERMIFIHEYMQALLPDNFPGMSTTEVVAYDSMSCLDTKRITQYMDIDLREYSFMPGLINHLMKKQRSETRQGLLSFKGPNFFPIIDKRGLLCFVKLWWKGSLFGGSRDAWHQWWFFSHNELPTPSIDLQENSRLFLAFPVPEI